MGVTDVVCLTACQKHKETPDEGILTKGLVHALTQLQVTDISVPDFFKMLAAPYQTLQDAVNKLTVGMTEAEKKTWMDKYRIRPYCEASNPSCFKKYVGHFVSLPGPSSPKQSPLDESQKTSWATWDWALNFLKLDVEYLAQQTGYKSWARFGSILTRAMAS